MTKNEPLTTRIDCLLECQDWKEPEKFSSVETLHGTDEKTSLVEFHLIFSSLAIAKGLYRKPVDNARKEQTYIVGVYI